MFLEATQVIVEEVGFFTGFFETIVTIIKNHTPQLIATIASPMFIYYIFKILLNKISDSKAVKQMKNQNSELLTLIAGLNNKLDSQTDLNKSLLEGNELFSDKMKVLDTKIEAFNLSILNLENNAEVKMDYEKIIADKLLEEQAELKAKELAIKEKAEQERLRLEQEIEKAKLVAETTKKKVKKSKEVTTNAITLE